MTAHDSGVAPSDALAVLTELVACVDGDCSTREKLDYWDKREAAAWDRARALVGSAPGVVVPDVETFRTNTPTDESKAKD